MALSPQQPANASKVLKRWDPLPNKVIGNQKRQTHPLVGFLLGGFIPNCCARHQVKAAKKEKSAIAVTKELVKQRAFDA